ncbi:MAG: HEAT repeat domain-containing protein, partial [Candidatus Poribacteria bacterium]|nr:HEAT repeat domain-containing protein [Candidatus Poribacteria bacterium]
DTSTRAFAASALGNIGKSAKKAIPNLTNNLRNDGSDLVRGSAAYALGQMKESAQSAIPDLVKALDDENELVRQSAAKALGQINLPQATEALKRHKANTPN